MKDRKKIDDNQDYKLDNDVERRTVDDNNQVTLRSYYPTPREEGRERIKEKEGTAKKLQRSETKRLIERKRTLEIVSPTSPS